MNRFASFALCFVLFYWNVDAHSQMTCAKWPGGASNTLNTGCQAGIRNAKFSLDWTRYITNVAPDQWGGQGQGLCQSPFKAPITSQYQPACASGTCDPMGTIQAGTQFTVMWPARNHAVDNQDPRNVVIYLSPRHAADQAADFSDAVIMSNQICSGPYKNCLGGNGETNPCSVQCTMPANLEAGTYTLVWYWDWRQNDGKEYSTCADIKVTAAAGSTQAPQTNPPQTNPPQTNAPAQTTKAPTQPTVPSPTQTNGIEFSVTVVVSVPKDVSTFSVADFTIALVQTLNIPPWAIQSVSVLLDKSDNQVTFLSFILVSTNGLNALTIAKQLKDLATAQSPTLADNGLAGLQVTTADSSDSGKMTPIFFFTVLIGFLLVQLF